MDRKRGKRKMEKGRKEKSKRMNVKLKRWKKVISFPDPSILFNVCFQDSGQTVFTERAKEFFVRKAVSFLEPPA